MRLLLPGLLAAIAPAWAAAQQGVYLSPEEALARIYPTATHVERDHIVLNAEERERVAALMGAWKSVGADAFVVYQAYRDQTALGWAVLDHEIGKTEPITFITEVSPDRRIGQMHVLVYREPVGGEIRHPRFTGQFEGKGLADRLRRDSDIKRVHGATLSTDAATIVARRALAVVQGLYLEGTKVEVNRPCMGSTLTIIAFGCDEAKTHKAVEAAVAAAEAVDALLSPYAEGSELNRVNAAAGSAAEPVAVSPAFADFVSACRHYSVLTGGAFDATIGPLTRAWGFLGGERRVPSDAEIKDLARTTGYRRVWLDRETSTVQFDAPGVSLDPGGIGKGWGADAAAAVLRKHGVHRAMVDLGGSTVFMDPPRGKDGWPVVLRHPRRPGAFLGELRLKNCGLSTSGDGEKFFMVDGVRYAHILDPRTGRPAASGVASVTVVAPSATWADAFSTGMFVLGTDAGLAKAAGLDGVHALFAVEADDGRTALALSPGIRALWESYGTPTPADARTAAR